MQDLKITLVQTEIFWQQPETNMSHLEEKVSGLAGKTDLILFPEMFNTGFTMDAISWHETMDGPTVEWMSQLAKKLDTAIGGSLIIKEDDNFYNRFLAFTPEGLVSQYDKRHLFRMANEHIPFSSGTRNAVFKLRGWKIQPQICYDLRFPTFSRNVWEGHNAAYDLLIYVANWPKPRVQAWDTLLKARAVENLSYCIGVNRIGKDGEGIEYNGHSQAVDFLGHPLNEVTDEDTILTITVSAHDLKKYRENFPAYLDADSFSITP